MRALRQGIGHDGRTLYPLMPYQYFRSLSDEDLASVIVFERSHGACAHRAAEDASLSEDIKKIVSGPFRRWRTCPNRISQTA